MVGASRRPTPILGVVTVQSGQPSEQARATAPSILLIEDEPGIVDFVSRGMRGRGLRRAGRARWPRGRGRALGEAFDAVVLDLMLPGKGGMEVLAALRAAKPALPVIVLTARGEIEDRVAGLDAGAVDYLVKPFSLAELLARVRAQLRSAAQGSTTTLRAADIEVDLLSRRVQRAGAAGAALHDRVRAARVPAAPPRQGAHA